MITVDDRIGSRELAPLLQELAPKVQIKRLQWGDFAIYSPHGGDDDGPTLVGVERKRIRDMIASMQSGRYSGFQMLGMSSQYDRCYLVVEGHYRTNHKTGCLELPTQTQGKYTPQVWKGQVVDYRALDTFLNTLRTKTGVQVIKTATPWHTAYEVYFLWHWYNAKANSAHKSHLRFPNPPNLAPITGSPSPFRRMVKELPHIGWELSLEVERFFGGDIFAALGADVLEWTKVKGVSVKYAQDIVKWIAGMRKYEKQDRKQEW